jgi:tetratricopeptide (TPR) repeat protein
LGRPEEALALDRKALELNPLWAPTITDVGMDLDALGRFDGALSWYEKSFDVDPGYSFNLWVMGLHYWLVLGEYGEAVRWFRKAVAADAGDPWNPASFGRFFLDIGDLDRAEQWIHQAIEMSPESGMANRSMQLLCLYKGDEASALDYARKAHAIVQR